MLVFLLLFLWAAVLISSCLGRAEPAGDYEAKLAAARTMQGCMDRVKEYKEERGIPLHPLDLHMTGMIGADFNPITTTLGEIGAKRTTANPDMAALAAQMLKEAGVRPGDRVGLCLSGSFPAMNLAVLSACSAMELEAVCFASAGSSTYGANNPELSFPEMLLLLMRDGLLPAYPTTVTLGGGNDCGGGMDQGLVDGIERRLEAQGAVVWKEPDFAKNIARRREAYGAIACYINVGGNVISSGREREIPQRGLIPPGARLPALSENSGLLELYHAQGIPVIHILNIKRLVQEYHLPFDPGRLPEAGESAVYYEAAYPKALIAASLILTALCLLYDRRRRCARSRSGWQERTIE